jgi:fumarase (EC 4.2.1.2)
MTSIKQEDLIQSIADGLQYISYYHPVDYIKSLASAYDREESPAAKDAIAQILINSRMCAEGHRPICQDTGIVTVFLEIGMDVRWDDATMGVEDMVHEGVRRAYNHPDNKLRASVLADPAGKRSNTKDNTPGVVNVKVVPGSTVDVIVAAKGGGSEAKSKFAMLNPSDSIVDWVLKTVPTMGAGWCPPGMLGIGIGGTAEKAMLLAKESLMEPIDITELQARGASNRAEELRLELYEKVNALGIGAQGPGRPDHGARHQGQGLPDPRGQLAGGDDPELRRHPPRALHPRWQRPGDAGSAVAGRLAGADLRRVEGPPCRPRHADAGRCRQLEAR